MMSCCGKKRNEYLGALSSGSPAYAHNPSGQFWEDIFFEYTGNTGLTVKGGITGRSYRFNTTGDRQQVDYRDAGGLMAIPLLKKIKAS